MWRCRAVLSDSNRRVLSHLYAMFACGGRCCGYFERSLCIRLTLSLQNELTKYFTGKRKHFWTPITQVGNNYGGPHVPTTGPSPDGSLLRNPA